MMKINELFYNGIIFVNLNGKKRLAKITSILESKDIDSLPSAIEVLYSTELTGSVICDVCEPIELDKQIFELLGFNYVQDTFVYKDDDFEIQYDISNKELRIAYVYGNCLLDVFNIEYLHQLQYHLLSCGVFDLYSSLFRLVWSEETGFSIIKRKLKLYNRYKYEVYLKETDEKNVYKLIVDNSDFLQVSYDKDVYYSVDPDGGPYLSVGGSYPVRTSKGEYKNIDILKIECRKDTFFYITFKEDLFK